MFQDIRRPKKSLREILPTRGAEEYLPEPDEPVEVYRQKVDPAAMTALKRRRGVLPRGLGWLFVAALFLIGGFFISKSFAKVSVSVTPKQTMLPLNQIAVTVPYEIATLDPIQASRPVTATELRPVERRASGTIVVYNNYSKSPQRLVANTRFRAASGKIYRIGEAITVPGQREEGGKLAPGSIEVFVTADQPGESYNAPMTDFTIPGFEGDPRFDKFYARSKTPMTGGFVGQEPVVPESAREALEVELKQEITTRALEQLRFQIPKDYVLFDQALVMEWDSAVEGQSSVATSSLLFTGRPKAVIIRRQDLTRALLEQVQDQSIAGEVSITNLESLILDIDSAVALVNAADDAAKSARLTVSGDALVTNVVAVEELQQKLSGIKKREAETVFQQFPAIAEARVHFRPPWVRVFPDEADKVDVQLLDPGN